MGKKAKLKQLKKNGETYNLLHYTKDLYQEIFPESQDSDYHAYDLTSEITRVKEEEKKKDTYISTIRHVVIGDAYLDWVEKENLENTYESRVNYAAKLTDEEVVLLWEAFKNETETRFVPFVAVSEASEPIDQSLISREQIEEAKAILAQTFQVKKESISIHPTFLRYEETQGNFVEAVTTMNSKEVKEDCVVRFLAVSMNESRKAIQPRKEFEHGRWTERKVPHVSLTTWAESVWANLPKDAEVVSVPGLLAPTQTKDFADAFQANLQRMSV